MRGWSWSGRGLVAVAAVLLAVAPAPGQGAGYAPLRADGGGVPALIRPVTVVLDDVTVAEAVRTIAREAGVGFTYAPDLPDLLVRRSVRARGTPAAEALLRTVAGTRLALLVSASGQLVLIRRDAAAPGGAIRGYVRDRDSGAPVVAAQLVLLPHGRSTLSGREGEFAFEDVAPGDYVLSVSALGFADTQVEGLRPASEIGGPPLVVQVERAPLKLAAMVVTPSHFDVRSEEPVARATLSREQIRTRPQIGEDVFRAINRLPGVSSSDMSSAFRVRGGRTDELYVTLDGLELFEPFHLKDFDAALSILDIESIGAVDLTTGGCTADVGNRLTGQLAFRSREPLTDRARTTLGLTLTGVRAQSQGGFAGGRGGWLASVRRGYLDLAFRMIGEMDSISPKYWDAFGKVYVDVTPRHRLTLHGLHAGDGLRYRNEGGALHSGYGSSYLWLTWDADPAAGLETRTVLSGGRLTWERSGEEVSPDHLLAAVEDRRSFDFYGLRHDGSAELSPRLLLRWGAGARALTARYGYGAVIVRPEVTAGHVHDGVDSTTVDWRPRGGQLEAYLSARLRPLPGVALELGGRWDYQGYTGESQLGPRLNLLWNPLAGTALRAAWGRYSQPQPLWDVQVQNGVRDFDPAETGSQVVVGLEQHVGPRSTLRVEAYRRALDRERPRWLNLSPATNIFPEVEEDRLRLAPASGLARGLELLGQWQGERFEWGASYAYALAEDRVGDRVVPRDQDQRHTFYLDGAYRSSDRGWRLAWAWQLHSGWPAVPTTAELDTATSAFGLPRLIVTRHYGLPDADRLPWYHRADVRATRFFGVGAGRIGLFLDIFNLFDSPNVNGCYANLRVNGGAVSTWRSYSTQIPRFYSFGASWEF